MIPDATDKAILTQLSAGPQSVAQLRKNLSRATRLIQRRVDRLVVAGFVTFDMRGGAVDRYKLAPVSKRNASEPLKTTVAGPPYQPAPGVLVGYSEQLRRFRDNCMVARTR
jgi:hypothetical protein